MSTRVHAARRTDLREWRARDLPPLSTLDRAALRIGLALMVWGRRHGPVDRAALAERHRLLRCAAHAALEQQLAAARRQPGGQII